MSSQLCFDPDQATLETQTSLLPRSKWLVIALNRWWRVCEDELQWMLQRHQGKRWRDRSLCRTRKALIRCIREHCGAVDPIGLLQVEALPEWH
jgi:hypothetical protein